jgi:hypothetical protein
MSGREPSVVLKLPSVQKAMNVPDQPKSLLSRLADKLFKVN